MPVDLLAVLADPRGPALLQQADEIGPGVDVGVLARDRDLADEVGMRGEQRSEPAVTGGLPDQAECGPPEQDRVAPAVVGIDRDDDRAAVVRRGVEDGAYGLDGEEWLVAEDDQGAIEATAIDPFRRAVTGVVERRHTGLERARQAAGRVGIADPPGAPPLDRGLQGVGIVAEDDHDVGEPGRRQSVEDVLEDRATADRREELAAPEPRTRPSRQHEGGDTRTAHAGQATARCLSGTPLPP